MENIDTPLGARIILGPPPEFIPEGAVMLTARMQAEDDPRSFQVLLSRENVQDMVAQLQRVLDGAARE